MKAPDLAGTSAAKPTPKWLPPSAGFLAAAVVAFFVCPWPVVHSLTPGSLIGIALVSLLEVFLANAVTQRTLEATHPRTPEQPHLTQEASLYALWLAPFALFIRENSLWAVVIAGVLAVNAVESFRTRKDHTGSGRSPLSTDETLFTLQESSPHFRRQAWGMFAALCAQGGVVAAFADSQFAAAVMVGFSSGVWTGAFAKYAPDNYSKPRSTRRPFWIVAVTIILTIGGLIRYLPHTYGVRGFGIPSFAQVRGGSSQGERMGETRRQTFDGSMAPQSPGDPGIILWPEKMTHTKLVAPVPAMGNGMMASRRNADPIVIPFGGAYWFFKAPDVHPPQTSRQAQGSPDALNIRSTDRRPLSMEAHDNLGSMIDLDCCSRIQVAIRNADRYPDTVSMELVLVNTALRSKPSLSLGTLTVKSTRPWRLYEESRPANEMLNFAIPAHAPIRRFDELMVVFRLDASRADAGPKIAIDRFVLVPRGL